MGVRTKSICYTAAASAIFFSRAALYIEFFRHGKRAFCEQAEINPSEAYAYTPQIMLENMLEWELR